MTDDHAHQYPRGGDGHCLICLGESNRAKKRRLKREQSTPKPSMIGRPKPPSAHAETPAIAVHASTDQLDHPRDRITEDDRFWPDPSVWKSSSPLP